MDLAVILAYASAIFGGAIALAVAWQERRSIAHWAFAAGMTVLAIESVFTALTTDAPLPGEMSHWQNWRLFTMSLLPGTWLFFSLSYARGNYREFLAKWRLPLIAAFLLPVGLAIAFQRSLIVAVSHDGPGSAWLLGLAAPGFAIYVLFLLGTVVVLMNLERTFRASVGTMRWRIKFMVLGLGVLFAARAYTSSQALLFHSVNLSLQAVNTGALFVACLLIAGSLTRAGHFDVGVYPSHSILHGSLTVSLAGIYLLIVGVLAKMVNYLGGGNAFTLTAFLVLLSLVALTVLLLSEKVRLRTKRFVSRHFQRPQYDYRTVWRTFTEVTARRVEQLDLCDAIVKLVSEVFQVLSVTVWLADDRKAELTFTTSTSLSAVKAKRLSLDPDDMAQVMSALSGHPDPVDIDSSKEVWAVLLRRLHPDEFREGGNRICVPLVAGSELLGVMTLGDRVGGVPYSLQDFDLLKSVAEQTAANVLNIRLSHRLAQGKQLEAFQAMSAFFVHDLKNTASTLSLMLQNLPIHFNDPGFREDALRGVAKTVSHINELVGRLSLLRQEISPQTVESDLNELVSQAVKAVETRSQKPAARAEVIQELRPLPKLRVDPTQIQNVVTNLLLNAKDALGHAGQVRVETSQRNGWAVLAVSDNGCGMSPEFIQRSLFRPFQTTKKTGIGIGMFQSRMVVEAHRGRIEVESQLGKGTSFRVLLPIVPHQGL